MLLKDSKTCIKTNGYVSKYFPISRSARQGCPIAPILYILQAEPLACSIRRNENIKGIELPNEKETTINMFADDTQFFVRDEHSIVEIFNILDIFKSASGSKINLDKTTGIYLGRWKHKDPIYTNISWSKTCVKTLGVHHGYVIDDNSIWKEKIQKIKSCLQVWKSRNLTLYGKSLVIKSLVISLIGYKIEARGISERYIKEIDSLIWEFV